MQTLIENHRGLQPGFKIELGFIPDKVIMISLSDGSEYFSYPNKDLGTFETVLIQSDGTRVVKTDVILPFEGEFIPPENEGEANTRLSKGIEIGDNFGSAPRDFIVESYMID